MIKTRYKTKCFGVGPSATATQKLSWKTCQNVRKSIFLFSLLFFSWAPFAFAQNIDLRVLKAINPENPTSGFWKTTSNSAYVLGGGIVVGQLIYGLTNSDTNIKQDAYTHAISIGTSYLISLGLKNVFNRTRPQYAHPDEIFALTPSHGASLPSGHTSIAFATATTLSLQYHKWYITAPAFLWAGSVGYSRMYLGKHYPTDVLAGAAIGVGSAYASHWLNQKLFKRPSQKR